MTSEARQADAIAQVREAYDRLMSAFASGSTDEYFACFHEDASFLFPGEVLLEPRSAYQEAWSRWEQEGVRFWDVVADDIRVRVLGDTAVVTHRVRTGVVDDSDASVHRERETIVFSRMGGRWLAVHEHLSPEDA